MSLTDNWLLKANTLKKIADKVSDQRLQIDLMRKANEYLKRANELADYKTLEEMV